MYEKRFQRILCVVQRIRVEFHGRSHPMRMMMVMMMMMMMDDAVVRCDPSSRDIGSIG
jgi:hypothetical protein